MHAYRSLSMILCLFLAGVFVPGGASARFCSDARQTGIPDIGLRSVAKGFNSPVFVTGAGDQRAPLYVVEQPGVIRAIRPGRESVLLDISEEVEFGGEKGLLGLAFHPRFATNRRFYVNYTAKKGLFGSLETYISEFRTDPSRAEADPDTERVLMSFEQPFGNHNGGMIAFGADGYLYVGTGDGGAAYDPKDSGQRLDTLLGKILRIDVDGGEPYAIPPDNPFRERAAARPEIYAYGLRNPWRFSFDPVTRFLYVGDVGQYRLEEVSVVSRGGNYGWRPMEGSLCTLEALSDCDASLYQPPIVEYGRAEGISITGGYVYRGTKFPTLCGVYLYGDYGSGHIWGLRYDGSKVSAHRKVLATGFSISSFGEGNDGELYVIDYDRGEIHWIVPARS